jgi:heme/copper-type cytochrome/quinol oxidase subunit 4
VLIVVSLFFIALGLVAKNWEIGILVLTAFVIACVLTYILWRIVDRKNSAK